MKQTPALPALINAIVETFTSGNATESARLFQVLYAQLRSHIWNAYCGVLFSRLKTNNVSLRAEEVFLQILNELEREIREGKFRMPVNATDKDIRKLIVTLVCLKAFQRTVDSMKAWKRIPLYSEADLAESALQQIPDFNPEEQEKITEGVKHVFAKLRAKDADILQTLFCNDLSKSAAKMVLMEKYRFSEVALNRAVTRAKENFRTHWREHFNTREPQSIPI